MKNEADCSAPTAFCTSTSLPVSSEDVASSRISTDGRARNARAIVGSLTPAGGQIEQLVEIR